MTNVNVSLKPFTLTTACLCTLFAATLATHAMAWDRQITRSRTPQQVTRSATTTGAYGRTVQQNSTATRTAGGYAKSGSVTGPNGNTATRQAQGQWDPATKTWTKSASATGPNGQTVQQSSTATRTANGYAKNGSVTGPNGNTATRQAQGQWDPATKTWTKSATVQKGE